ncbi:hypothetical protein BIW11_02620 [Tropilaelaps mercedesae]|uniref:Uncharacterized protein n=1 Tax=Tropilaelaps mercedesae TaxID=418985 RepID=A0A1V9XZZ7_9ACAR|nr:hypothetical protein BIW11_02620 [Tropilaelaps mercedesae]
MTLVIPTEGSRVAEVTQYQAA